MNKILLLILPLFFLTACGDHLDGEIVAKNHEPGYVQMIPQTSCQASGKTTVCSTHLVTVYIPDCWRIVVKGHDKESTGDTCIDEDKWINFNIGDEYVGDDVKPEDRKDY